MSDDKDEKIPFGIEGEVGEIVFIHGAPSPTLPTVEEWGGKPCPRCGEKPVASYGLSGGGVGGYLICHGVLAKTLDPEPDE